MWPTAGRLRWRVIANVGFNKLALKRNIFASYEVRLRIITKARNFICPFYVFTLFVKEMEKGQSKTTGLKSLIKEYKDQFDIPENRNHYSIIDYQEAEKRYVKHCLQKGSCQLR